MTLYERVDQAVRNREDDTRSARIERTIWLSEHLPSPAAIMGRAEPLHIMEEVKSVFIHGHFVGALILALAVIEHCLVEELQLQGSTTKRPVLSKALERASAESLIPSEWVDAISVLVLRRNSYLHFKSDDDDHGIIKRVRAAKVHPKTIMEADAKEALEWMYKVFQKTLHEVA